MTRAWNFSAGPATLPLEVLQQVREDLPEWHGIGASIMEVSHRGKAFSGVIEAAQADLRELLAIPEDYEVLFLQGGQTLQFAQVPMNLLAGRSADYLVTGAWSQKAHREAARIGKARLVASTEENGKFLRLPDIDALKFDENAAYCHLCTNETIHGVEVHEAYEAKLFEAISAAAPGVSLVADMSSHILSRPLDVRRYGLLSAGAQKNIGPSGMTLVIVRKALLGRAAAGTPTILDYRNQADNGSMLNTPPAFAIYVAGLVFQWLKAQGGLDAMAAINREKAKRLYAAIDNSEGFYKNPVDVACRSSMNVPFTLPSVALEAQFVQASEAAGFIGLKGHKSVGGIRASLYNAVPLEAVQALVRFMEDFRETWRRRGASR
ncbi:MAG: 3-phosphoserine/phosphohydroxythreonine transaminase [Azoarcus sp.]|jgi:phosphoserine aminotransferase|nr:3-phosphoserine/phosphohydroxythreonine transaminase [Azoarcus sp.]